MIFKKIMREISQAFIFAAGRGERMRPLTDTIPKPLVQVNNKSILDYNIEKLLELKSIEKVVINGFYLAEQIQSHIDSKADSRLVFSHEKEKLETGGGLAFAADKIDFEQPLLLLNGDVFWQENGISEIGEISKKWFELHEKGEECDILMGLKKIEEYVGYEGLGDFNFDPKSGELQKFLGKKMSHAFVGLQIINPKILRKISNKMFSMSVFYQPKDQSGELKYRVKGMEMKGDYFHVGTVEAIGEVERLMVNG